MNIDSMIQGNPQALVTSYNGVLVADSLEVADRFGKAHKNVVRDIENLMDGIEANRLNFEPIAEKEYFIPDFYTDKRNREQKRYKLTRDGFSLKSCRPCGLYRKAYVTSSIFQTPEDRALQDRTYLTAA